jgi:hypothetical protein
MIYRRRGVPMSSLHKAIANRGHDGNGSRKATIIKVANGRFDQFPKPAPPGLRCSGDQRETEWYNTQDSGRCGPAQPFDVFAGLPEKI